MSDDAAPGNSTGTGDDVSASEVIEAPGNSAGTRSVSASEVIEDVDYESAATIRLALISVAILIVISIYAACWVMNCAKHRHVPSRRMRSRYRCCEMLHDRIHHDHWVNHCIQLFLGLVAYVCWALYVFQPQNDYVVESSAPLAWAILFSCLFVFLSLAHCVFKYRLLLEDEAYYKHKGEEGEKQRRLAAQEPKSQTKSRAAMSLSTFPESKHAGALSLERDPPAAVLRDRDRAALAACHQGTNGGNFGIGIRSGSLGGASSSSGVHYGSSLKDPFDDHHHHLGSGGLAVVPSAPVSPSHAGSVSPHEQSRSGDQFASHRTQTSNAYFDPHAHKSMGVPYAVSEHDPFETVSPATAKQFLQQQTHQQQQHAVLRPPQLIPQSVHSSSSSGHSGQSSLHHSPYSSPQPSPRHHAAPAVGAGFGFRDQEITVTSAAPGTMAREHPMVPTEVMPVAPQQAPTPAPVPIIEPHQQPVTVVIGGQEAPDGAIYFKKVTRTTMSRPTMTRT